MDITNVASGLQLLIQDLQSSCRLPEAAEVLLARLGLPRVMPGREDGQAAHPCSRPRASGQAGMGFLPRELETVLGAQLQAQGCSVRGSLPGGCPCFPWELPLPLPGGSGRAEAAGWAAADPCEEGKGKNSAAA